MYVYIYIYICIYIHTHIYMNICTYTFILLPKITAVARIIKMIIAIAMSVSDHTALRKSYLLYVPFAWIFKEYPILC